MGKRRRAREMAVQMLYQRDLGGSPLDRIFESFDVQSYSQDGEPSEKENGKRRPPKDTARFDESFDHARQLVEGAVEHSDEIDEIIRRHADNWRLERMPTIDRNILRLAIYEMLHESGVPKVVVVDEAIELAKKFGSEESGRFVNGLLDAILHARSTEEQVAGGPA